MSACDFTDFSERPASLIGLCDYQTVSMDNLVEIREIIAYLHIPEQLVVEGDHLTIHIIDNRIDEIKGFLAVWQNKGIACINTGEETSWGKWYEDEGLFLTGDVVTTGDDAAAAVMGRIAYNAHGVRGIYSKGVFLRLLDRVPAMDAGAGSFCGVSGGQFY